MLLNFLSFFGGEFFDVPSGMVHTFDPGSLDDLFWSRFVGARDAFGFTDGTGK
jgi:hypothetical protein